MGESWREVLVVEERRRLPGVGLYRLLPHWRKWTLTFHGTRLIIIIPYSQFLRLSQRISKIPSMTRLPETVVGSLSSFYPCDPIIGVQDDVERVTLHGLRDSLQDPSPFIFRSRLPS